MRELTFFPGRSIEAMLYIAQRLKAPTIHEVLKLRYFADKLHFSQFGFMASGDRYDAMEFGPVASGSYDLLKAARGDRTRWIPKEYIDLVEGAMAVEASAAVRPLRDPNLELLSAADVQCIDEAIERWGNMSFAERTRVSHDSAYECARAIALERGSDAFPMSAIEIAKTLENSELVLQALDAA